MKARMNFISHSAMHSDNRPIAVRQSTAGRIPIGTLLLLTAITVSLGTLTVTLLTRTTISTAPPNPAAVIPPPLIDEPIAPLLAAAAAGELHQASVRMGRGCFTGVVMASRGYPDSSDSGREITGVRGAEAIPELTVYHAGTARTDGHIVTAGGRVLTVVGGGASYAESIVRAYAGVLQISFDGMQFRHDIGRRALVLPN